MRITSLLILFFLAFNLQAQQEPQFTMFWNNYSVFNPAATGLMAKQFASLNARNQFSGFEGSPWAVSAVYERKLPLLKSGLGFSYYHDELGMETNNKLNANYAFHLPLKRKRTLSLGIAGSYFHKHLDADWNPFDVFIDPLIPAEPINQAFLEVNAGLMYNSEKLLLGFSATQLRESESRYFQNVRHLWMVAAYKWQLTELLQIRPGIFIKSDEVSSTFDLNVLATLQKRYWAGATYRHQDAIALMAGVNIARKYRVGYSYDIQTSGIRQASDGSHELVLAYLLRAKE